MIDKNKDKNNNIHPISEDEVLPRGEISLSKVKKPAGDEAKVQEKFKEKLPEVLQIDAAPNPGLRLLRTEWLISAFMGLSCMIALN